MKIGFNMLLWTTNLVEEQFDLLKKIKDVGYDGVEIPIFGGEEKVSHFANIGKAPVSYTHLTLPTILRV